MKCCGGDKSKGDHPKTITIFISFFFLVNFVLGAGFLGIPFTFFHGGVFAGACTLVVISFTAWKTAVYELETMARAQALADYAADNGHYSTSDETRKPNFVIKDSRKFEMAELCKIFVGKCFMILYVVIMLIHGLLTLLTYTTVASSAWAVNIPLNFGSLRECSDLDFLHQYFPLDAACGNAYRLCAAFFATIVVPLSLLDLKEQAIIQFLLGIFRFVLLIAVTVYCLYHIISGDLITIDDIPPVGGINATDLLLETSNLSMTSAFDIVFHFDFKGWVIGVPVIFYAIMMHQGIPSLIHPIKEKHWLKWAFVLLFAIISCSYLIVSTLGALWFRDIINETFTLNWASYTSGDISTAIKVFSYFIILFPSIDVCSVYPLVVHALSNNIYLAIFNRDTSEGSGLVPMVCQLVIKLVVALVPIIIGLFVTNLVFIVKFAGLVGFFIGLVCPIVLQIRSQWVCVRTFSSIRKKDKEIELDNKTDGSMEMLDAKVGMASEAEDDVGGDKEPLIDQDIGKEPFSFGDLKKFLFSYQDSVLYYTPYSSVFSHPLSVVFISVVSIAITGLAIASVFTTV